MEKKSILIVGTFLYDNSTPFPQAKLLSDLLESEGYTTTCVSQQKNKLLRLVDICYKVIFNRYDYVFIQIFSGPAFIYASMAILLGRLRRKRVVGVLRGGGLPNYLKKRKIFKIWVLKNNHTLIAPSGYLHNEFLSHGLNTIIIPNIVNLEKYTFKHRSVITPKILWVRRYIDIYNPLMAIKVAKNIKEQYGDVKLTMAGGGDITWVKDVIIQEELEDNVTLIGFITKSQINSLGQQHDLFINTANIDNFPVTVVEAMAMGLIIVSTNVGGIPFFLEHNTNAKLVNPDDDEAMANEIMSLFENSDLCENLCESSHETVSDYSWDRIRNKYMDIFN